jgi:integrase
MEIWKTLRVSHIPTPPAATTDRCLTRRYTNPSPGTKDRSGHDLTSDGGFCTVQRLKGSLKTTQPLVVHDNPLLNELPAITKLLATLGPKERLFGTLKKQNANYRFAKYATLAGLPKHRRHTHCLRHSRAMHTIKQAGIENVRQLCGHASIASTGYYLRVSDQTAWAALGAAAGL